MMVPAAAARFWGGEVWTLALVSTGIAFASSCLGLLASFHLDLPSGPAIVLTASAYLRGFDPDRPARRRARPHRPQPPPRSVTTRTGNASVIAVVPCCWPPPSPGALARPPPWRPDAALRVVTSISILGDMIRNVGGDARRDDGADRARQPTPMRSSPVRPTRNRSPRRDLVVVNGLGLEGWLDRLVGASGYRGQGGDGERGRGAARDAEEGKTVADPHAWQDLANGRRYVENIERALAAADPTHAARLRGQCRSYLDELASTDAWVRAELDKVPPAQRKVVSSHDAFGYFARGLRRRVRGAPGISEDAEPSAADIKRLIDQIRDEHIKVLFLENALSPRLIEQIGTRDRRQGRRNAVCGRAVEARRPRRQLSRHVPPQRPAAPRRHAGERRAGLKRARSIDLNASTARVAREPELADARPPDLRQRSQDSTSQRPARAATPCLALVFVALGASRPAVGLDPTHG